MKRVFMLMAWAAVVLSVGVASAASPQVEAAIKSVQSVGADPAKLKTFCELNKLLEAVAEKEDPAAQKQVEELIGKLGPDFSAAWDVGDELDEASPDGQAFYAAVDALAGKCK